MSYHFGDPLNTPAEYQTEWMLRRVLPDLLAYIGRNDEADKLRNGAADELGRIARGEPGFLKKLAVELEAEFVDRHSLLPDGIGQRIWDAKLAGDKRSGLGLINQVGPVVAKHLRPSPVGGHIYRVATWADAIAHADSRWPELPVLSGLKAELALSLLVIEPTNRVPVVA